jgi:tetratricopeptide (TPR) repeat protein
MCTLELRRGEKESTVNKKDEALRQRRYMQNEAITYARNGNWEAAIDSSRQLLSSDPNDIETLNRLAKAYFENGELDNAEQTYQRVLEISEHNPIARRMVSLISRTRSAPAKTREFVDMRMFAIETGKSTLTSLHIDTDAEISLVPGEKLTLRANTQPAKSTSPVQQIHYDGQKKPVQSVGNYDGQKKPVQSVGDIESESAAASFLDDAIALDVYDCNGVNLGRLEPRLAARLIRFMKLGNEYTAAVLSLNEKRDQIQIVIRESHRNPDNRHEVSFPGKLIDENDRRVGFDEIEDDIDEVESVEDDHDDSEPDEFSGDDEDHDRLDTLETNNDADEEIEE